MKNYLKVLALAATLLTSSALVAFSTDDPKVSICNPYTIAAHTKAVEGVELEIDTWDEISGQLAHEVLDALMTNPNERDSLKRMGFAGVVSVRMEGSELVRFIAVTEDHCPIAHVDLSLAQIDVIILRLQKARV